MWKEMDLNLMSMISILSKPQAESHQNQKINVSKGNKGVKCRIKAKRKAKQGKKQFGGKHDKIKKPLDRPSEEV